MICSYWSSFGFLIWWIVFFCCCYFGGVGILEIISSYIYLSYYFLLPRTLIKPVIPSYSYFLILYLILYLNCFCISRNFILSFILKSISCPTYISWDVFISSNMLFKSSSDNICSCLSVIGITILSFLYFFFLFWWVMHFTWRINRENSWELGSRWYVPSERICLFATLKVCVWDHFYLMLQLY